MIAPIINPRLQFLVLSCDRNARLSTATIVCASFLVLAASFGPDPGANDEVDHVAAAKAAERSLHAACDAWSAAQAEDKDRKAAAAQIQRAFEQFYAHARALRRDPQAKRNIVHVATAVSPTQSIASAGKLRRGKREEWSYVVWRSDRGLMMTEWKREDWRTHVFRPGVVSYLVRQGACSAALTIEPQKLARRFSVGSATWDDEKRQQVLHVPYELDGAPGVIAIRRDGDRWQMKPDRGIVGADGVWRP